MHQEIMNLAARRGLFFPSAEIYADAPAGFFEFGNEGLKIKRHVVQVWREELVEKEQHLEIGGTTILPEAVFRASGHLENFNDPLVTCEKCKTPYRADKLVEEKLGHEIPEGASTEFFDQKIAELQIVCPKDKTPLGKTTRFSLMMKLGMGATLNQIAYLRPEACQSLFLDFNRIWKTGKVKLPFGLAQVGRAYRNEIAPRQGLLRTREFEQMDVEVFFNPAKINDVEKWEEVKEYELQLYLLADKEVRTITCAEAVEQGIVSGKLVAYYLARCQQFFEKLNIPLENMRFRELEEEARAFYAKETWDFEVKLEEGWVELVACNYRTDHDLQTHSKESKQDLRVKEDGDAEKFFPHIFELSVGVDRTVFCVLNLNYRKEQRGPEERIFLDLPPRVAPYLVGVYPLMKKDGLGEKAKELFQHLLSMRTRVFYEESGSIGKRYARADEVGVPYGITIDYQTLEDKTVTLRERNSMKQKRIPLEALEEVFWKFSTNQKSFDDLAE